MTASFTMSPAGQKLLRDYHAAAPADRPGVAMRLYIAPTRADLATKYTPADVYRILLEMVIDVPQGKKKVRALILEHVGDVAMQAGAFEEAVGAVEQACLLSPTPRRRWLAEEARRRLPPVAAPSGRE